MPLSLRRSLANAAVPAAARTTRGEASLRMDRLSRSRFHREIGRSGVVRVGNLGGTLPPVKGQHMRPCGGLVLISEEIFFVSVLRNKKCVPSQDSRSPDLPVKDLEPYGAATATP